MESLVKHAEIHLQVSMNQICFVQFHFINIQAAFKFI